MAKRLRYLYCSIICLALLTGALTANVSAAEHKVIGIAGFENEASSDLALAPLITNLITQDIVKNRSYKLVPQPILNQRLSRSGIPVKMYEQLDDLEAERFAGMNFLLAGVIKEAAVEKVRLNGFQQLRARVLVNVRMAHIPAQQIIYAETIIGEASQIYLLERQDAEENSASRAALLETAAKRAVAQIAAKVNSINPMTGIVISVAPTDSTIIIDMGSEHGVAAGQMYQIYKDGSVLLHPITNLEVGRDKQQIAMVMITRADPLESAAKLISGRISDLHPGLKAIIKSRY